MAALERLIKVLAPFLTQADTIPEIAIPEIVLVPVLAGCITDFYTGREHISKQVVVASDEGIPEGENWHKQLSRQVADGGEDSRPLLRRVRGY